MSRIILNDLVVTQNKLRHPVKALMITELSAKPIVLTRTEDEVLYVHDGHHRLFGLWKSGVRALDASYFKIKDYTYADLNSINLEVGWVTPIDFRTHCRRSDLSEYKSYVLSKDNPCFEYGGNMYIACMRNKIRELQAWYMEPRKITSVGEFTDLSR